MVFYTQYSLDNLLMEREALQMSNYFISLKITRINFKYLNHIIISLSFLL